MVIPISKAWCVCSMISFGETGTCGVSRFIGTIPVGQKLIMVLFDIALQFVGIREIGGFFSAY
jgi:hypothetical protein